MPRSGRSLPQAPPDPNSAMALVCTVPPSGREERRASVHDIISQATMSREVDDGIVFSFENADDVARSLLELVLAERTCCAQFSYSLRFGQSHAPIELHIRAVGELVRPLKALYVDISRTVTDSE